FDVCIYFDGDTLLEAVKQGNCFDIILMDIEMKRMNGISAAKIIRKIDEDVQLIYISSHEEYVLQLFD
ncbi:response regulator, partial [Blautia sp. CAG:257]